MMKRRLLGAPTVMGRSVCAFFLATVATAGLGCGIQEHSKAQPAATGGQTGSIGTGGSTSPGTGGNVASTGGSPVGTGGTASGGSNGSGGNQATGTGGRSAGSGGSTGTSSGGSAGTGGTVGTGGATGAGTGGAASGVTINIAGTVVPKEKAIAIIHFGHSNMLGHAAKPANLQSFFYTTQPQLWIYQGSNSFVAAKEPTAPSAPTDLGAGPGMAILKTAAASAASNYHFISIGRGEGSSTSVDWLKASKVLYPTVMQRALELKGKVTFGAIFVMLGITERHLPTADQPGFPTRMAQIIADMRADLGEPNLPVLFCNYEMNATGTLSPTSAVGVATIPMLNMLPGLITNLVLVRADGPEIGMQDDHHFDFTGQKAWSERGIQLMKDNGWFHWAQ